MNWTSSMNDWLTFPLRGRGTAPAVDEVLYQPEFSNLFPPYGGHLISRLRRQLLLKEKLNPTFMCLF